MSHDHKAQFNILVARLLELLVNACPTPVELTAKTLGLEVGSYEKSEGRIAGIGFFGTYTHTEEERFLEDCLVWLVAEQFIRPAASDGHYVATLRALKLYEAVPGTLAE